MKKENNAISGAVTKLLIGFQSKKISVLNWKFLPEESIFTCMNHGNIKQKNKVYRWCHLFYNPLNATKTLYRFHVAPVGYRMSTVKKSLMIMGGYFYDLHLEEPAEQDNFEKKLNKKELFVIVKHAVTAFHLDFAEAKNDYEALNDISFSLPPDSKLIKCIDHRGKKRPWEFECGPK